MERCVQQERKIVDKSLHNSRDGFYCGGDELRQCVRKSLNKRHDHLGCSVNEQRQIVDDCLSDGHNCLHRRRNQLGQQFQNGGQKLRKKLRHGI